MQLLKHNKDTCSVAKGRWTLITACLSSTTELTLILLSCKSPELLKGPWCLSYKWEFCFRFCLFDFKDNVAGSRWLSSVSWIPRWWGKRQGLQDLFQAGSGFDISRPFFVFWREEKASGASKGFSALICPAAHNSCGGKLLLEKKKKVRRL